MPYIVYCLEIWGHAYKTNTMSILTLQKRAIRTICKTAYREHTNQLFINSNVLKFYDLVDYVTLQFMYKVKNKKLPMDIQELFELRFGSYSRRPWTFIKPVTRTNTKSHCISCKGVQLWNGMSEPLRSCEPWPALKRQFKQLLINGYKEENWYNLCAQYDLIKLLFLFSFMFFIAILSLFSYYVNLCNSFLYLVFVGNWPNCPFSTANRGVGPDKPVASPAPRWASIIFFFLLN